MNTLTIHTLTALPLHNLNRDENGAPKQVLEGGVTRARLSSQATKRAARIGFERALAEADRSVRSKVHADSLVEDVVELAESRGIVLTKPQVTKVKKALSSVINKLTKKEKDEPAASAKKPEAAENTEATPAKAEADKKDTLVWLSAGERAGLVRRVLDEVVTADKETIDGDAVAQSTDSLAIAAFGRMFAAAPSLTMEAAVSVGNATTTHEAAVELDYFTAVDDLTDNGGAGQLGYQMYTSGVYYQAVTIDRAQLLRNFNGDLDAERTEAELSELVRQLITALPQGKKSGTAPFAMPSVVLIEEQSYRTAYAFQTPVQPDEDGGYLAPSAAALEAKAQRARLFDPDAFGATFVTGTDADLIDLGERDGSLRDATAFIVEWIRAGR